MILLTPTADMSAKLDDPNDPLNQHAAQVRELAATHHVGLVDSLAAFQSYGIQPGPLLLEREASLVWILIASLFIGNLLLLLLNLPLAPAWAKLLQIPRPYLYAGILFFASMGAYAVNSQPFDLFLLLGLGLLGFAMRRYGLPVLPLIVGVILGPLAEKQARRSLQLTGGDPSGLIGGPVAWVCYATIAVVLLWPLIAKVLKARRGDDRHDVENKSEVSV